MKLSAIVESPSCGMFNALFRYEDSRGREVKNAPSIRIPCQSYEHARAVVGSFQYPPAEDGSKV